MKKLGKAILKTMGLEVRRLADGVSLPITSKALGLFTYFEALMKQVEEIPGSIVECGVGRGRSLLFLAHLASTGKQARTLWGYDSFEGFPEPSAEDDSFRKPKKGQLKNMTAEGILDLLRHAGISKEFVSTIRLVPGFFDKTVSKYDGGPIALLNLDVDLYQSYLDCLNALYPKVVSGGIVVFDEYDSPAYPGGRKAIDEYLADKKVTVQRYAKSRHYVVKP